MIGSPKVAVTSSSKSATFGPFRSRLVSSAWIVTESWKRPPRSWRSRWRHRRDTVAWKKHQMDPNDIHICYCNSIIVQFSSSVGFGRFVLAKLAIPSFFGHLFRLSVTRRSLWRFRSGWDMTWLWGISYVKLCSGNMQKVRTSTNSRDMLGGQEGKGPVVMIVMFWNCKQSTVNRINSDEIESILVADPPLAAQARPLERNIHLTAALVVALGSLDEWWIGNCLLSNQRFSGWGPHGGVGNSLWSKVVPGPEASQSFTRLVTSDTTPGAGAKVCPRFGLRALRVPDALEGGRSFCGFWLCPSWPF